MFTTPLPPPPPTRHTTLHHAAHRRTRRRRTLPPPPPATGRGEGAFWARQPGPFRTGVITGLASGRPPALFLRFRRQVSAVRHSSAIQLRVSPSLVSQISPRQSLTTIAPASAGSTHHKALLPQLVQAGQATGPHRPTVIAIRQRVFHLGIAGRLPASSGFPARVPPGRQAINPPGPGRRAHRRFPGFTFYSAAAFFGPSRLYTTQPFHPQHHNYPAPPAALH